MTDDIDATVGDIIEEDEPQVDDDDGDPEEE